jgi:hypothetical protein
MTVYLSRPGNLVILSIRAEGDGAVGDARITVRPGTTVLGRTYDEWAALPEGAYEPEDDAR